MRLVQLAVLLLLSAAGCGPAGGSADDPSSGPTGTPLVVGTEAAYPPFENVTATGDIVGFDVDLVRELGKRLDRPVEIRNLPFDSLLLALDGGELDLVCSGMSYTDERARKVDFSAPYLRVPMGVLLGVKKAGGITSPDELDRPEVVIAVQRGTTGAVKAKARFPNAALREFDTEDDAANELLVGRAHAFVYDVVSVRRRHAKHPDATRVLATDLGSEDYCIAFRKGSALKAPTDAFLAESGAWISEKIDTWFPEEQRAGFVR